MNYNINSIRSDFPILEQKIAGKPLIYLDNGATTQKPKQVIDSISKFYSEINGNIHRGVHQLSQFSTDAYEEARQKVRDFINAKSETEVIFTRGTTESINLIAHSFGRRYIHRDDEIIISEMEHHSNIVPWQMLCEQVGAKLRVIPFDKNGELCMDDFRNMLSNKTKLVAITHISNSLGTVNPIREVIDLAHKAGAAILIDGAQAVQHTTVDVSELNCDFYVFSGHKMYAPTGIGVLYGKKSWLDEMPPYQGGGDMIDTVTFKKTTYAELPLKFEAGTTNYVGAMALGKAIDYIQHIGIENIETYEKKLFKYAAEQLSLIPDLRIIGNAKNKSGVISFLVGDIHHYDTGMLLDKMGIAVRTGNHCTQPLMTKIGITGTVRASFALYNTQDEIDKLCSAIERVKQFFS